MAIKKISKLEVNDVVLIFLDDHKLKSKKLDKIITNFEANGYKIKHYGPETTIDDSLVKTAIIVNEQQYKQITIQYFGKNEKNLVLYDVYKKKFTQLNNQNFIQAIKRKKRNLFVTIILFLILAVSLSVLALTVYNYFRPLEKPPEETVVAGSEDPVPWDEKTMCDSYQEQQSTKQEEYTNEVIKLINEERVANGLDPLVEVDFMSDMSQARAEAHRDERTFWAHYTVEYGLPNEHLNSYGLLPSWKNPTGNSFEISAMGEKSPEEVVDDWMNSPTHYNFIMHEEWKYIGAGFADESWPYYYYTNEDGEEECLPYYYIEQRQGTAKTGTFVWTGEPSTGNYLSTYWIVWLGGSELDHLVDLDYSDYDDVYDPNGDPKPKED